MIFFSNFWNDAGVFFWTFALIACLIAVLGILPDLFLDHNLPGWAKALWILFLIFVPFIAVLVYVVARGRGMGERWVKRFDKDMAESSGYSESGLPVDDIERSKQLLASGAITQADYDKLRADGNA